MLGPRPPTRKKTKGKATLGPCWYGGMLGRGMFGGEGGHSGDTQLRLFPSSWSKQADGRRKWIPQLN